MVRDVIFIVVAVSPDAKVMASCGDSNQVTLFRIDASKGYTQLNKLTTVSDAGFSCAWNNSSTLLAVATQDGYVCVWDVRRMEQKLTQLSAQQKSPKGACRSVKFSQSYGMDLLAFSEVSKSESVGILACQQCECSGHKKF